MLAPVALTSEIANSVPLPTVLVDIIKTYLWHVNGKEQLKLRHGTSVRRIEYIPATNSIMSVGRNASIIEWKLTNNTKIVLDNGTAEPIWSPYSAPPVICSSEDYCALFSGSNTISIFREGDSSLKHWCTIQFDNRNPAPTMRKPLGTFVSYQATPVEAAPPPVSPALAFVTIPENPHSCLAVGAFYLLLYDLKSATQPLLSLRGHTDAITSLLQLPDGILLSSSWDRTIKAWDLSALLKEKNQKKVKGDESKKSNCLWSLEGHTKQVNCLLLLPSNSAGDTMIASGGGDQTIRIWNLTEKKCVFVLEHDQNVLTIALLPNGYLASAANDMIYVWSIEDGKLLSTLEGHRGSIYSLVVLPNGYIASCGADQYIRL